ncbi:MAG TPA: hypothetical protein VKD25_06265 [Burkholderiales bacterium]|nr:hypothetical protein [Burkholderiales bacterium]
MKRTLIALALTGLLANAAFAEPTLTGDDTYNQVHLIPWRGAPESTANQANSRAAEESAEAQRSNTYGQYGIYEFNP